MLVFGIISLRVGVRAGSDVEQCRPPDGPLWGGGKNRTCDEVKAEALSAAAPLVNLNQTGSVIEIKRGTAAGTKTTICALSGTDQPCKSSADKENYLRHLEVFQANVLISVIPGMGSTKQLAGARGGCSDANGSEPSGAQKMAPGAIAIMMAASVVMLCICGAIVVDFGMAYVNKRQAQTAADAGALAAAQVYKSQPGVPCTTLQG